MQHNNLLYFDHIYGISPKDFKYLRGLSSWLQTTSIGVNTHGVEFVASCEGVDGIPIYVTEFHLEKHQFETRKNILVSHTQLSLEMAMSLGKQFMSNVRTNDKKSHLSDKEWLAQSISNYSPEPNVSYLFDSVYLFQLNNSNSNTT